MDHPTAEVLEEGIPHIASAPKDEGRIDLIVRRPRDEEREVLEEGTFDEEVGLVGDNWQVKPCKKTSDRSAHPHMQVNIMNSRAAQLFAGSKERWPLAGDQLYVDFDLSAENLPVGTQLEIGSAILEVTEIPHLGCAKFARRFGSLALKFVNSEVGRSLHLRGINAKVVQGGQVLTGGVIRKVVG
ncbi:MAG: hypothetical protein ACI97A_003723 [Planctomycetota bacterium]|jgi:hypothetical protein